MTDGKLHLYCEKGWSYAGPNEFEVRLNGENVGGPFAAIMNAFVPPADRDPDSRITHGNGRYCYLDGAESYTLEDLADDAMTVFALEVIPHDGEGPA